MAGWSPFAVLDQTFALLGAEPHPLAVDGRQLGHGAPARQVPIGDLRSLLLDPTAGSDLQARVIEVVVGRLQQNRDPWVVVLGGPLLPALRHLARQATPPTARAAALRIEAELLSRLLLATRRPPHDTCRFAMHLLQQARG
jgi:hypothetical protein